MKKNEIKTILGIDTSCDETSIAIVEETKVIANVVSSQVELHRKYGGVVPSIAKREHEERLPFLIKEVFIRASKNTSSKYSFDDIDAIAVTYGPGLAIALEVGIKYAKKWSKEYNKPLIAVNHMEGHLLSSFASNSKGNHGLNYKELEFPSLGLILSGGHTELVLMHSIGDYEVVGKTVDDAIGECYDKVARMLGLGYPGGAILTEFAKYGDKYRYKLPVPMGKDSSLNFSYSGLKTAIYYMLKDFKEKGVELSKKDIYDFCASFEYAVTQTIEIKLKRAIKKYAPKAILVGGGVSSSAKVRMTIRKVAKKFNISAHFPEIKGLNTDNGAMIAIAGFFQAQRKDFADENLDRNPNLSL